MTMLNGEPIDTPNISTAPGGAGQPPTATPQSQGVGLVMGIMALIFAFAIPPGGIIIGAIALSEARHGGYRNPLALWGFILGIVFSVLIVLMVVAGIVFGVGLFSWLIDTCQQLGPGTHNEGGITYEC